MRYWRVSSSILLRREKVMIFPIRRNFSLKAILMDSSLFEPRRQQQDDKMESKNRNYDSKKSNNNDSSKDLGSSVVSIEGVTDVLTKYRAKLRKRGIYRSDLSSLPYRGDARMLRDSIDSIKTDSSLSAEQFLSMDSDIKAILDYLSLRRLIIYVGIFNDAGRDYVFKSLEKNYFKEKIKVFDGLTINGAIAQILESNNIKSHELLLLSNDVDPNISDPDINLCLYGKTRCELTSLSYQRKSHFAYNMETVKNVIEEFNGVSYRQ